MQSIFNLDIMNKSGLIVNCVNIRNYNFSNRSYKVIYIEIYNADKSDQLLFTIDVEISQNGSLRLVSNKTNATNAKSIPFTILLEPSDKVLNFIKMHLKEVTINE